MWIIYAIVDDIVDNGFLTNCNPHCNPQRENLFIVTMVAIE